MMGLVYLPRFGWFLWLINWDYQPLILTSWDIQVDDSLGGRPKASALAWNALTDAASSAAATRAA